ncbi:uncharacterized protein DUF2752 [Propionicimonas paludicola]|uniref:Uncharacterized protein DUF2752 n=1 Tax=Propionicimonas paludicola TaxID=185243 RepID=A0A2A9CQ12_9ACTN|nr:DUF2752 domain-containing protein [Propionicimonas paludicola]PFG15750.1 uncharacterized protein DUF2752 [Propionicimonas paludicola]
MDPNQPGHYPSCPTYALTGWYCPGCGALRALHFLTVGNLEAAWAMNPAAVLAVPYLAVSWLLWARREITGRPRAFLAPGWLILSVGIGLVVYGVLRNVPGLEVLAPHRLS